MQIKGFVSLILITLLLATAFPQAFARKKHSQISECDTDAYTCMRVKRGQIWESLFPDEREREIVMRLIIVTVNCGRAVIKIPNNLVSGDLLDYSPFPRQIEAPQEKVIVFDPKRYAWAAYEAEW